MKKVGIFTEKVINLLHLELLPGTPIYIGETNIEHIKNRHPYEYDKYFNDLVNIIEKPDYVGRNPKDDSILFVKEYTYEKEYIRVAVKVTEKGKCFAKTLHLLSTCNAERYIEKETLLRLDNNTI